MLYQNSPEEQLPRQSKQLLSNCLNPLLLTHPAFLSLGFCSVSRGFFCSNKSTMLSAKFKPCKRLKSSTERTVSPCRLRGAAGAQSGRSDQLSRPRADGPGAHGGTIRRAPSSQKPIPPSAAAPGAPSACCPRGGSEPPHKDPGAAPSPAPPGVPCIEALGGCRPPAVLSTTAPPAPSAARRGARAQAPGRKRHSLRAGQAAPPSPLSGSPPANRDQLPRGTPGPPAQLAAMRGTSAAR